MNISRRFFIGGALSSLAFGGQKMFAAPKGLFSSGKANLTFGVVSDVHIAYDAKRKVVLKGYNGDTFEHTLMWFRDQGVDAVMIAGDIADRGFIVELQIIADIWNKVFPNNKAPDGRRVEKIFVSGNHDVEGFKYGKFGERFWPDPNERAKHLIETDFKKNWEKVFDEEYSDIYKKEVNGYTFIGQHWGKQGWGKNCKFDLIKPFMEENKSKINTSLPFFYVQHPHLRNTCFGPAGGGDAGITTAVLSAYPNAVAFSGHSHMTLMDNTAIWQGAFTSIGASSLRYVSVCHRNYEGGYENLKGWAKPGSKLVNGYKVMEVLSRFTARQGMLVKVFNDRMTVNRRDFVSDFDIGDEWVLPLSTAEGKPYSFAEHAKKETAPQFPAAAKIKVRKGRGRNRGDKKEIKSEEKDILIIKFPKAIGKKDGDMFHYEILVEAKDEKQNQIRHMLSVDFLKPKKATAMLKEYPLKIACDTLPQNTSFRFVVTPMSSFGLKGKSIASDWV